MKAAGIVILFPLISVVIVSLYVHGGAARVAALALLVGSLTIALFIFARRTASHSRSERNH
jgi:hypothetical protein